MLRGITSSPAPVFCIFRSDLVCPGRSSKNWGWVVARGKLRTCRWQLRRRSSRRFGRDSLLPVQIPRDFTTHWPDPFGATPVRVEMVGFAPTSSGNIEPVFRAHVLWCVQDRRRKERKPQILKP